MITLSSLFREIYTHSHFISPWKNELRLMEILSKKSKYISTFVSRNFKLCTKRYHRRILEEKKKSFTYLFDSKINLFNLHPICKNLKPIEHVVTTKWRVSTKWKPNPKANPKPNITKIFLYKKDIVYSNSILPFSLVEILGNSLKLNIQEKQILNKNNMEERIWQECIKLSKNSLFFWTFSNHSCNSTFMMGNYPWQKGLLLSTVRFYSTKDNCTDKSTINECETKSETEDKNLNSTNVCCTKKLDSESSLEKECCEDPSKNNVLQEPICENNIPKDCDERTYRSDSNSSVKDICPAECPIDSDSHKKTSYCSPQKPVLPCPPAKETTILKFWKFLSIFAYIILLIASIIIIPEVEKEKKKPRPPYYDVPYMYRRAKPFPWGDGNHSLFHNPRRNPVPPDGYEVDDP